MVTKEKIKKIENRINDLYISLEIKKKKYEIKKEKKKISNPFFWKNTKKANKIMNELRFKKKYVKDFCIINSYFNDLKILLYFFKKRNATEKELEYQFFKTKKFISEIEFKNFFSEEEDILSAVLQISSGAGGTESCDWTSMLMRMYYMWAEKNGYKIKEINRVSGDRIGLKSITFKIEGEYAFGYLKGENGVHRLVRISPFDSSSKRHTSFSSVYVYPLVNEDINIKINISDISWDTFRSSGSGGQNVNKVETGIRLYHNPTNIVIENTETRSQIKNKEKALQLLKSRLFEIEINKRNIKKSKIESIKKKIEWGSQIRNYVIHPYKKVKDIRTGYETSDFISVMNGNINNFLKKFIFFYKKKS